MPVNIKGREYETVDMTGNPVERKVEVKGKSSYVNNEGTVIPTGQLCKKIIVNQQCAIVALHHNLTPYPTNIDCASRYEFAEKQEKRAIPKKMSLEEYRKRKAVQMNLFDYNGK